MYVCIYIYIYICTHTNKHKHTHAHTNTYIHTYIHTYRDTHTLSTAGRSLLHTQATTIKFDQHTYIPTYLHTHIHTYRDTHNSGDASQQQPEGPSSVHGLQQSNLTNTRAQKSASVDSALREKDSDSAASHRRAESTSNPGEGSGKTLDKPQQPASATPESFPAIGAHYAGDGRSATASSPSLSQLLQPGEVHAELDKMVKSEGTNVTGET